MSLIIPTTIQPTECIGNSLATINNNFNNLYQDILTLQTLIQQLATVPVGTIAYYGLQNAPTGWIPCDGTQLVSGTSTIIFTNGQTITGNWSNLYSQFSNGVLPDLRGLFIRGSGTNGTYKTYQKAYANGGKVLTYSTDDVRSHTHTDAGHNHIYVANTLSNGFATPQSQGAVQNVGQRVSSETGKASIQSTGGSETKPVNVSLLACIKY
jgi:microcystin-dependent protein